MTLKLRNYCFYYYCPLLLNINCKLQERFLIFKYDILGTDIRANIGPCFAVTYFLSFCLSCCFLLAPHLPLDWGSTGIRFPHPSQCYTIQHRICWLSKVCCWLTDWLIEKLGWLPKVDQYLWEQMKEREKMVLVKTQYLYQSKVAKGQGMKRRCVKQVDAIFRGARLR